MVGAAVDGSGHPAGHIMQHGLLTVDPYEENGVGAEVLPMMDLVVYTIGSRIFSPADKVARREEVRGRKRKYGGEGTAVRVVKKLNSGIIMIGNAFA